MLSPDEITEIFYLTDEFSKEFDMTISKHQLRADNGKKHRNKPNRLSNSEIMMILVAFHLSGMRCLKHYYLFYVCKHLHASFPHLVSYNRFVELQQQVLLPLVLFLKSCRMGKTTAAGINFIDSTSLKVRHIKREHSKSKVFDGIATKGCGMMGWFFGFKLQSFTGFSGDGSAGSCTFKSYQTSQNAYPAIVHPSRFTQSMKSLFPCAGLQKCSVEG